MIPTGQHIIHIIHINIIHTIPIIYCITHINIASPEHYPYQLSDENAGGTHSDEVHRDVPLWKVIFEPHIGVIFQEIYHWFGLISKRSLISNAQFIKKTFLIVLFSFLTKTVALWGSKIAIMPYFGVPQSYKKAQLNSTGSLHSRRELLCQCVSGLPSTHSSQQCCTWSCLE